MPSFPWGHVVVINLLITTLELPTLFIPITGYVLRARFPFSGFAPVQGTNVHVLSLTRFTDFIATRHWNKLQLFMLKLEVSTWLFRETWRQTPFSYMVNLNDWFLKKKEDFQGEPNNATKDRSGASISGQSWYIDWNEIRRRTNACSKQTVQEADGDGPGNGRRRSRKRTEQAPSRQRPGGTDIHRSTRFPGSLSKTGAGYVI